MRKITKKKVTQKTLQRLPLTHALKGFFLWFKPVVWWMSINCYHSFHTFAKTRFFTPSLSTRGNMLPFKPFLQYFATRSDTASCQDYEEYMSVCRKRLKLSTYLHTVSYKHMSFVNTRSQLLWVLASSEFYLITWRMISRSAGYKIHFRKQPPFRGNVFPLSVWLIFHFFLISTPWQFVHGSRVFTQSNK